MRPSDLKPLFNNIPINEVLKIDINQTTFTKTVFQWDKNAEFGVDGYDPSTYQITMWHQLTAGLQLKLTYKNESNMKSTIDVTNDFKFNYANKGANIRGLVDASTAKVEASLKDFIVEVSTTTAADSFGNLKNEVKLLVLEKLNNDKIVINNVDPVANSTLNKYDKYVGGDYMYDAMSKSKIDEAISSLQTYLSPSLTTFKEGLANWIGTGDKMKKVKINQNNINIFGKCTISNWSISGLTLKPMTLDFVNARSDQTQAQWAEQTGVALAKIFYPKGEFGQKRIDLFTDGNLTIYMNPNDFDDFVRQDKKMSDISDYITMKVSAKARANGILQKNISLTLNGLWQNKPNPTLSNTKFVEKVDDNTFKIARNAGVESERMHGYNYLTINYDNVTFQSGSVVAHNNNHILFNNWIIKKANTNVW